MVATGFTSSTGQEIPPTPGQNIQTNTWAAETHNTYNYKPGVQIQTRDKGMKLHLKGKKHITNTWSAETCLAL